MTTAQNTTSANAALAGINSFGYLIWWTIQQKVHNLADLRTTATANNLPQSFVDKLTGADPDVAFKRATNLSAGGRIAKVSTDTIKYRFVTRSVKGDNTRILALETLNSANVTLDTLQLGNLTLDAFNLRYQSITRPVDHELAKEMDQLIGEMGADLQNRIGRLDDQKLRSIVLSWCSDVHRVSMRNTGGVYFVPTGSNHQTISDQILGIIQWFNDNQAGTFSAVELYPTPTTSIDDIVNSAIDEIANELLEVETKLQAYADNVDMNAGSRGYSAGTQVDRLKALKGKGSALLDSLGDPVALTLSKIDLMIHRAQRMQLASNEEVQREREAKLIVADNATVNPSGKLQGTARQRRNSVEL